MRRHRFFIVAMALCGAFFSAHLGTTAAIIGVIFCVWIIACAFIPAPADDTKEPTYADRRTWPGL